MTRLTAYPIETMEAWPRPQRLDREDQENGILADGRPILPLILEPMLVRLIRHQELGNTILSSIHSDKRVQQGRPTRII